MTRKSSQFSLDTENEPKRLETIKHTTADNKTEIKLLRNNTQSNGTTDNSQKPQKTQDNTKSENKELSKFNPDESPSNPEVKISLGSIVREVAKNMEPKGGRQLAELIASVKADSFPHVNTKAAKTAEIKQLLLTEKSQLGIKTVLPEKLKGKFGLKTDLPERPVKINNVKARQILNVAKMSVQNKSISSENTTSNDGKETKLSPEVLVNRSHKKLTDTRQNTEIRQISTLNIKKAVPETDIVSKTTVADRKVPVLQTESLKATSKASESRLKVNEVGLKKSALNNKRLINDQAEGHRRFEESSKIKRSLQKAKGSIRESNVHKLNITNVQNSTKQAKIHSNSTSSNRLNLKAKQIYSHSNPQTGTIEQSITTVENAKASNLTQQSVPNDVPANIGKQILESIHSSLTQQGGDKQITVHLNPPELGEVFIKFQEQDTQITGMLEVSKTQTRFEIEQALPQIIRNLSDSGINIKRLEVVLTSSEQSDQETLKDNSLFNNQQQQQNFNNPGLYEKGQDVTMIHEWLADHVNSDNNTGLQDTLTSDSSINILI